jgi:hypothetical protein
MDSSQLISANQPGLAVARWKIMSRTDELTLEIFQAPVESGLLEAIVLSVILLRSGHALGDTSVSIDSFNPTYSTVLILR